MRACTHRHTHTRVHTHTPVGPEPAKQPSEAKMRAELGSLTAAAVPAGDGDRSHPGVACAAAEGALERTRDHSACTAATNAIGPFPPTRADGRGRPWLVCLSACCVSVASTFSCAFVCVLDRTRCWHVAAALGLGDRCARLDRVGLSWRLQGWMLEMRRLDTMISHLKVHRGVPQSIVGYLRVDALRMRPELQSDPQLVEALRQTNNQTNAKQPNKRSKPTGDVR